MLDVLISLDLRTCRTFTYIAVRLRSIKMQDLKYLLRYKLQFSMEFSNSVLHKESQEVEPYYEVCLL